MSAAPREQTDWSTDNRFHLFLLCAAGAMLTFLLSQQLLTDDVLAAVEDLVPSWMSALNVSLVLCVVDVIKLALRVFVVGLVLQFVLLTLMVEAPFRLVLDAALWAAWAGVAITLCRLLLLVSSDDSPTRLTLVLVPGSLAHLTQIGSGSLTPVAALLNLLNPFELLWVALLAWRLSWLREYGRPPVVIALVTWTIAVLPLWLIMTLLPALVASR